MVKLALTLLSLTLLATGTLSVPSREQGIVARVDEDREDAAPSDRLASIDSLVGRNLTDLVYISDFAGAVYDTYAPGTFKFVTGTFVVPTPRVPGGSSGTYFSAAPSVGIDGSACDTASLRVGLEMIVSNGTVSCNGTSLDPFHSRSSLTSWCRLCTHAAWYRWIPADIQRIPGISLRTGHTVRLNVTVASPTTATVSVENLSTGQSAGQVITSVATLCEQSAEWIVRDFTYDSGAFVPFADFGTVTFTGAEAGTDAGRVGPGNATIYDIRRNARVLTSTSVSGEAVTITYVGGN